MPDTVITVRGSATARYAPEHAIVTGAVGFDGGDRDLVLNAATLTSDGLTARLEQLTDASRGPVTRWSAQDIHVWSERPWSAQGTQLDPVFHAQLAFTATFTDVDALSTWVDDHARIEGVAIHGVSWGLSPEAERAALRDVRAAAVRDARERAEAYATSLGLGHVQPIAIADPGMLGDAPGEGGEPQLFKAAMAADVAGPQLQFTPSDLEIAASVDARFAAR